MIPRWEFSRNDTRLSLHVAFGDKFRPACYAAMAAVCHTAFGFKMTLVQP